MIIDSLIPSNKAAKALGIQPQTLRFWRQTGTSPTFVKLGGRVFYKQSVLEQFIADNTHENTSEAICHAVAAGV